MIAPGQPSWTVQSDPGQYFSQNEFSLFCSEQSIYRWSDTGANSQQYDLNSLSTK